MHFVRCVKHVDDHVLMLTFEDGSVKLADLAPFLEGEVFEPLRDISYFKTVRVNPDLDTVVWDNGADFAPEFLYDIGVELDSQQTAIGAS